MSERTKTIERWMNLAMVRHREAWRNLPGVIDGHGLLYVGNVIEATGGNGTIAKMLRTSEHGETPLLRMGLPNQVTIRRWREIYRIAERKGVQVVVVPRAVLDNSDIRRNTIQVVASERRPRLFRPPQQVIQATVAPRWTRKTRTSYFLSGYDLNERGLSYFFCELPTDAVPTTVEEAYQSLKPESVRRAEAQGRKVMRQGDMFFIKTRGEEGPPDERIITEARLFDTNHFVSEYARHNGLVMVRGKVFHNPVGRRPDHATLRLLGNSWWIAVRNTVPVTVN
jgi:hypothetical protein